MGGVIVGGSDGGRQWWWEGFASVGNIGIGL